MPLRYGLQVIEGRRTSGRIACCLAAFGIAVATTGAQSGVPVESQQLVGASSGGNLVVVPPIRHLDNFGTASAVEGNIAVVGAPSDDVFLKTGGTLRLGLRSGAAYIFERDSVTGLWNERQKIFATLADLSGEFGASVALEGNLLIVGAPASRVVGSRTGAAHVFQRNPLTRKWQELQTIVAPDAVVNGGFGASVAIDGQRLLIGALNGINSQGAAYIFERSASSSWQLKQKLTSPALGFGRTVTLEGTIATVGAPNDGSNGRNKGSVFIYGRNGANGEWTLAQRIFAPEQAQVARARVDGSGVETVATDLVGLRGVAVDAVNGKVYWASAALGKIQRANLDGTDAEDVVTSELFVPEGVAVDPAGGKIYWAASFLGQMEVRGKIMRANLDGSAVQELLTTPLYRPQGIALDPAGGKLYWATPGSGVLRANLDGSAIQTVAGATNPNWVAVDAAAGKVYWTAGLQIRRANLDGSAAQILIQQSTAPAGIAVDSVGGFVYWTVPADGKIRRARLDGTDLHDAVSGLDRPEGLAVDPENSTLYWTTGGSDTWEYFGSSLAFDGETLIVGASGGSAVYVFHFEDEVARWKVHQKLEGESIYTDGFGAAVDLNGDLLAVGANLEYEQHVTPSQAGAGYLFQRDPVSRVWGSRQRILASNPGERDLFGSSVAVTPESLIVGAPQHDLSPNIIDSGLAYVFDLDASAAPPVTNAETRDTGGTLQNSGLPSAQAVLTFNTNLNLFRSAIDTQHQYVFTECDPVLFSVKSNRLDSLGAPFGSLVGKVFATILVTGIPPWFDGSSTLTILRGVEPGDANLNTVEFAHKVPCQAFGLKNFTAVQGVTGSAATGNLSIKVSWIQSQPIDRTDAQIEGR